MIVNDFIELVQGFKSYIDPILDDLNSSYQCNLKYNEIVEAHAEPDPYKYIVISIYGGLNGAGNWVEYMNCISDLLWQLSMKYKCWVVDLVNDCLDDVFTLRIGLKPL